MCPALLTTIIESVAPSKVYAKTLYVDQNVVDALTFRVMLKVRPLAFEQKVKKKVVEKCLINQMSLLTLTSLKVFPI